MESAFIIICTCMFILLIYTTISIYTTPDYARSNIRQEYEVVDKNRDIIIHKYETKYLEVPVDHFNFVNTDTFNLKYLVNDEYWLPESGAPIFFYPGNEVSVEDLFNIIGFMRELAPEFNALIVFAEHRYYGTSLPYGNESFKDPEHWGYFTIDQAIADNIDLITYLRRNQGIEYGTWKSPVITFGGSYSGMLAAWMRMRHPDAVTGSLASSAPMFASWMASECSYFTNTATAAFKLAAEHCPNNVKELWGVLDSMIKTDNGRRSLSERWNLCTKLESESEGKGLKSAIARRLRFVSIVNYPYPANLLGNLPGNPIKKFCSHLTTENLTGNELIDQIYLGLSEWFNYTGEATCYNISDPLGSKLDSRGWTLQTHIELIFPTCNEDSSDNMFEPSIWDWGKIFRDSKDKYDRNPRPGYIAKNYGGREIFNISSNIIFSNGQLDPWSGGGVKQNYSDRIYSISIPDAAHHLDLMGSNPLDPESVVDARLFYKKIFRKWIQDYLTE